MSESNERASGKLYEIHRRILAVLEQHPEGISINAVSAILGIEGGKQVHFNRRFRDLYQHYEIEKLRVNGEFRYALRGRKRLQIDAAPITKTLRAAVLHGARGRCSMCGRTVAAHGITLVVDHKVPRTWGGSTALSNLWALCSECNEGKRDFFASVESPEIRAGMAHKSVHVRIGETLKAAKGPVDSWVLDLVAGQSDWMKRLRELRYLGWRIEVSKRKLSSGRVESSYEAVEWTPWPDDPTGIIRQYEIDRARRRRGDA